MRLIRLTFFIALVVLIFSSGVTLAQEGRGTFKVFDNDAAVIDLSKKIRESGNVFRDKDGDGIYDTIKMYGKELSCDIDPANAYGVTYQDGKKVVYYPSVSASIPKPGEFLLYGFVHYFDQEGQSLYFAVVVKALTDKEMEALKKTKKDKKSKGGVPILPYSADFFDSNGLRVGVPTLYILPHSALVYNADFQRFNKSKDTILLGTNPAAPNREVFMFRKVPEFTDKLLLIHYRWY
jgi:hypothetical protein